MRLDSANRSFLALTILTLLLGTYVLCGAVGNVLVPLLLAQISHESQLGLTDSVPSLLPVLLFTLPIAIGLALGAHSLARQIIASNRLAQRVRALALPPSHELAGITVDVGLNGRVALVDSPEWFSFAYGVLTPRVVVSRGLLEGVSAVELRAVLEHERYHVCNLDPLKAISAQALSDTFFFLPALDSLRLRYVAGRELAADRRAIRACGHRPLAGALLKVVRGPEWSELEVAAAIGGPNLLDARVAQLESGKQPKLAAPSFKRIAVSLAGVVLFAATFLAAVLSFGGLTAVHEVTGTGLSSADLLGALTCAIPFAVVGLLSYLLLAQRANRPLSKSAAC
jgi:Zn-dependent protease with chaperone function